MSNEKVRLWERRWLEEAPDADSHRTYRPTSGPDEPVAAPLGRASASGVEKTDEAAEEAAEIDGTDPSAAQSSR